jgi:flagellar biosynthesis chaperone FliJ
MIISVLTLLRRANNERWFKFYLDFAGLVQRWTPAALGIEALYDAHRALVETADLLLEQLRKSFLTDDIKILDGRRDDCITAIRFALKSLLKSSDPAIRKDANKVMKVLDNYGNIAKMDYDTESAAVYNFVQDMEGKYGAEAKKLELEGRVAELKSFNAQLMALTTERYAEQTARPDQKLADVRRRTDASYANMIKVIEAGMITNPDHNLDGFVKELNVIITHYKTVDAQKQGRKNAKNAATDE